MNGSAAGQINTQDLKNWKKNLLKFLIPLVLLYISQIISLLSMPGHLIGLQDFVPTLIMVGGMALYILNGIFDFLTKLLSDNP